MKIDPKPIKDWLVQRIAATDEWIADKNTDQQKRECLQHGKSAFQEVLKKLTEAGE